MQRVRNLSIFGFSPLVAVSIGLLGGVICSQAATIDTAVQTQTFPSTLTDFTIPLTFNKFVSPDPVNFPFLTSITFTVSESISGMATVTNLATSGPVNDYTEILSIITSATGPDGSTLFSAGAGNFDVTISLPGIGPTQSLAGSTSGSAGPITNVFNNPSTATYQGAGTFDVTFTGTGFSDTKGPTPLQVTDATTSASGTVSVFATYSNLATPQIPEPAWTGLLGLGVIGLGYAGRRFRSKKN